MGKQTEADAGFTSATISVNGGPHVPMDVAMAALDVIKGRKRSGTRDADGAGEKAFEGEHGLAPERLRSIVERVERLNEERKALGDDIKDIFAEAKSAGFDVKALRQVIKMRTWDTAALEEHEALVDLYRRALGV